MDFEGDDANVVHIARHDVTPAEAEEALLDPRRLGMQVYQLKGEPRWAAVGATETGRVLFVVYTKRGPKIRVITAQDAERDERRRYRRR
ncbi:BrnT family toxin [Carboxydochorda subterranea]|uniref:BrnT family toxin n=1 Tax=Carboxydichorda subterranea TaxID=3109565 RepID=A0ABZ1C278_9FIRM|nr:BrnT family toxin [Limnochorda sp. L945t]WRP18861.1 BrnT family toxin [Limnochorda sp. L945t]